MEGAELRRVFQMFDRDGDGLITRKELTDRDGDGFITVEELRSVLASLGFKQGRAAGDCRRMISQLDVDGDGMVNFTEFRQMMKGGSFAASVDN